MGRAAAEDVKEGAPRSLDVVLKSFGALVDAALREGVTVKDVAPEDGRGARHSSDVPPQGGAEQRREQVAVVGDDVDVLVRGMTVSCRTYHVLKNGQARHGGLLIHPVAPEGANCNGVFEVVKEDVNVEVLVVQGGQLRDSRGSDRRIERAAQDKPRELVLDRTQAYGVQRSRGCARGEGGPLSPDHARIGESEHVKRDGAERLRIFEVVKIFGGDKVGPLLRQLVLGRRGAVVWSP